MKTELLLDHIIGFQWDKANQDKNRIKHAVSTLECEEVFFNAPLLLEADINHSAKEKRYFVLGKTDCSRKLFIAFAIRNALIRVISARDMHRKERTIYEIQETNTII